MVTRVIIILASIGVGLLIGALSLWGVTRLALPPQHQLYQTVGIRKPVVIGFQPYWLLNRADKEYAKYTTETVYFGLVVNSDGTVQKLVNPQEQEPGWTTLNGERLKNRLTADLEQDQQLSLLIHNSNESSISALLKDPEKHGLTLVTEVAPIMRQHQFTDLNIDIESFREASPEAQLAYDRFLTSIKTELQNQQLGSLTVELTPASLVNQHLINPRTLGQIADRVVLMTYDFHYTGSEIAGPVAPIGGTGEVREYDVETSLKEAVKVIPAEKIIMGIPLYGYQWETLATTPGAPTIPRSGATSSHRRVEELLSTCTACQTGLDPLGQQPYLILPTTEAGYTQQIYYEDQTSLAKKVDLARQYQLGGVALWALGYEGGNFLEPLASYKASTFWR